MSPDALYAAHSTTRLPDIRHLPADVLVLIFSSLRSQDIARCITVCRCFADVVHSNLYLQYRIELVRNGMVDGDSNTLPMSERLQRLRQYSSRFRNGDLDHKDLTEHPDYALQMRNLRWNIVFPGASSSSAVYSRYEQGLSESYLSVFTPGSAQAGIQSTRCLLPVVAPGGSYRGVKEWAIDRAQDLLVTVEWAEVTVSDLTQRRLEEVHFCSMSGSKSIRTTHPAATLPSLLVFPPDGIEPTADPYIYIFKLCIAREHVIWELDVAGSAVIEVCNWKTGQIIKRIEVRGRLVNFAPLDDAYLLVTPTRTPRPSTPCLNIYSLSPSTPNQLICALELPNEDPGKRTVSCQISTGEHSAASERHFRADPSLSLVALTLSTDDIECEYSSTLLIPRATILANIRAPESRLLERDSVKHSAQVAWADWGPRGCLRLWLRLRHPNSDHNISLIPFGSRIAVVAFEGPDCKSDSVYVFDINPFAARYAKHVLAVRGDQSDGKTIVEDVGDVLPGVVDPECSTIPYVVYRFKLPYFFSSRWHFKHIIRSVEMSMTGFTAKFDGVSVEESLQTWTV